VERNSFFCPGIGCLLALSLGSAWSQDIRVSLVPRDKVEGRLREYSGTNAERGARLRQMFADVGCGEQLSIQLVKQSKVPNVMCVLPGTTDRTIIVGAHFDRVSTSDGVADNWSGASLLPSFYAALKIDPRRHTYVFIGFTDEEMGLVGSRFYVRTMTPAQVAGTAAMINLDTLGLAPTEVWSHRADKRLMLALVRVADYLAVPISGVNFEQVGSTDSESFHARKIPRLTIHSITQKSENAMILHTKKDKLSAMNLDQYYETYHLVAVYLAYLDHYLSLPESAGAATD